MFTLTIETDNAAFGDDYRAEIARLLRSIATRLENGTSANCGRLYDHNGNHVGDYRDTSASSPAPLVDSHRL